MGRNWSFLWTHNEASKFYILLSSIWTPGNWDSPFLPLLNRFQTTTTKLFPSWIPSQHLSNISSPFLTECVLGTADDLVLSTVLSRGEGAIRGAGEPCPWSLSPAACPSPRSGSGLFKTSLSGYCGVFHSDSVYWLNHKDSCPKYQAVYAWLILIFLTSALGFIWKMYIHCSFNKSSDCMFLTMESSISEDH